MRGVRRIVVVLSVLVLSGIWMPARNLSAQQDSARSALIGVWEGTVSQSGNEGAPIRFEFSERDGALVWHWSWKASFGNGAAEGTVSKYEPPSVELNGRYTAHPIETIQSAPVRMSLSLTGTSLNGTGLTTGINRPFTVSATKR